MKFKKIITVLVIIIAVCSAVCSFIGVSSDDGPGQYTFTSINGEEVAIYGKGLYKHESLSMASQVIPQDYVILFLATPGLLLSLYFSRKSLKALFLLAGTLGFYLYTYMTYAFVAMYNYLFLVYILLMTCSLVAFIIVCVNIFSYGLKNCFHEKPRLKFTAGFMLFMGISVAVMWLERIIPPLFNGTVPETVEHYSTLVVQVMDIGVLIPALVVAGVLTIKKIPLGYFLSMLLSVKTLTLLISITAMMIGMANNGVPAAMVEMIIFGVFNLIAVFNIALTVKSIIQPPDYGTLSR